MPTYHVTTPSGQTYEVNTPHGASENDAIAYVRDNVEGNGASASQAADPTNRTGAPDLFVRGATMGGSDYLGAGARWLADNTVGNVIDAAKGKGASYHPFNEDLKSVRGDVADYTKQHPILAPVAEFAGGIAPGFGAGFQAAGAGVKAGTKALGMTLPAFAERAVEGAGVGGLAGALSAQSEDGGLPSLGDLGHGVARGAEFGGVAGAATPYIAAPLAWAGNKAAGGLQSVIDMLPYNQVSKAGRQAAEALAQDGTSVDQLAANHARLGSGANAVDAAGSFDPTTGTWLGGRNTRTLADTLVQMRGTTPDMAERILKPRPGQAGGEVLGSVQRNLAPGSTFHDTLDTLSTRQQTESAPLYKQAYDANKNVASPELDRMLATPAGQDALAYARTRVQNKMSRMGAPDPELTEQYADLVARGDMQPGMSPGGVASGMKLSTYDLIKQALNDKYSALQKGVQNGTVRAGELADHGDLTKAFTKALDNADVTAQAGPNSLRLMPNGEPGGLYKQARMAYAGPAQSMDAMDAGRAFMKGDREIVANDFADMTPSEQQMFRVGAAREIQNWIEKNGTVPPQLHSILNPSSKTRQILQTIFPDQQSFQQFLGDVGGVVRKVETSRMLGGSQTFSRTNQANDLGLDLSGVAIDAMHGNAPGAISGLLRSVGNYVKMPLQGDRDELGRLLLDPKAFPELLQALRTRAQVPAWAKLPGQSTTLLDGVPGRLGGLIGTHNPGPSNQTP